jgi:hypothetical protein
MNSSPPFLVDERALARRLGVSLPPLRKFNLATFGVDPDPFLRDLAPTFHDLPWDLYDVKLAQMCFLLKRFPDQEPRLKQYLKDAYAGRCGLEAVRDLLDRLGPEDRDIVAGIEPHRQRTIAGFVAEFPRGRPELRHVPMKDFTQNVGTDDYRSLGRAFAETSPAVVAHPAFGQWLAAVARLVHDLEQRRPRRVLFVLHQMRTLVRRGVKSEVVPEGIHQDGAKYIVSALVVERAGVVGGESVVYGPDKHTVYYHTVLQPGEGIFQVDHGSPLWHSASPIRLDPHTTCAEGRRGIFGLDINIEV